MTNHTTDSHTTGPVLGTCDYHLHGASYGNQHQRNHFCVNWHALPVAGVTADHHPLCGQEMIPKAGATIMEIIIRRDSNNARLWWAYPAGGPERAYAAKTAAQAIGDLIMQDGKDLGITVREVDEHGADL